MRNVCTFFLIALAFQFSSAQLDLSFIDPLYYLYNLQNNNNFNNIHNINNNDNFNNENNNFLGDFYQQPFIGCIANANNLQGTCMAGHECKYSRGAFSGRGNCSLLHSCCTYTKTCNQTVRARVVYFQNPANPRSGPSPCTLRLQLLNEDICQIRVDIMQLDLESVEDPAGLVGPTCREFITVDPAPIEAIPQICGITSNNHFYIHLNRNIVNNGYVNINVLLQQFATNLDSSGTWSMRLTQLECPGRKNKKTFNHKKRNENQAADDFGELAPAGCAQYFTQQNGIIQFFTDDNSVANPGVANNLIGNEYAACFKRLPNICGIVLTRPPSLTEVECNMFMEMLLGGTDPPVNPTVAEFCMPGGTTITLSYPGPLFLQIISRLMIIPGAPIEYALTTVCPAP